MTNYYLSQALRSLLYFAISLECFSFSNVYTFEEVSKGHLPLFYWQEDPYVNFGDYLSYLIVHRIVGGPLKTFKKKTSTPDKMLLGLGSIMYFAREGDVIWGTGVNGKRLSKSDYKFTHLDVRAVRGPYTRAFLYDNFGIESPEIYGDPALLFPYLFPEFTRSETPQYEYIVIPHYSERALFPRVEGDNIVYPTDPWDQVISKILTSKFVISSSLHGVIIAEAYGIPARLLRVTQNEPIFKFKDYYSGTQRPDFHFAVSVEEALIMGGEPMPQCDLGSLYEAFPFEFWPEIPVERHKYSKALN